MLMLDVAKADYKTKENVDDSLYSMAQNIEQMAQILKFVTTQEGGNITTQRWVNNMLAMLSSEPEWLNEVFIVEESAHPLITGVEEVRNITVPFANKLNVTWDDKTELKSTVHVDGSEDSLSFTQDSKNDFTVHGQSFRLRMKEPSSSGWGS